MHYTTLDPPAFAQIIPASLPVYLAVLTLSQDSAQAFFSEIFPLDTVGVFSSVQLLPLCTRLLYCLVLFIVFTNALFCLIRLCEHLRILQVY